MENKRVVTSKENEGVGGGRKGYYVIIWYHVCENFENCKALQNLKNLSLS